MDISDDKYPTPKRSSSEDRVKRGEPRAEQIIDPALSDMITSPATESNESPEEKAQGVWVDNIRVIENLRRYVQERLQKRAYEGGGAVAGVKENNESKAQEQDLYPVLRSMEAVE